MKCAIMSIIKSIYLQARVYQWTSNINNSLSQTLNTKKCEDPKSSSPSNQGELLQCSMRQAHPASGPARLRWPARSATRWSGQCGRMAG